MKKIAVLSVILCFVMASTMAFAGDPQQEGKVSNQSGAASPSSDDTSDTGAAVPQDPAPVGPNTDNINK